jgi:hypothetical protein
MEVLYHIIGYILWGYSLTMGFETWVVNILGF